MGRKKQNSDVIIFDIQIAIYLRKYSETMENCIHSFVCRYWAASAAVAERQRDFAEVEAAEPPPVSVSGGRVLPDREMSRSDRGLRSPGTCEASPPQGPQKGPKRKLRAFLWSLQGLNLRPSDYESDATNQLS